LKFLKTIVLVICDEKHPKMTRMFGGKGMVLVAIFWFMSIEKLQGNDDLHIYIKELNVENYLRRQTA